GASVRENPRLLGLSFTRRTHMGPLSSVRPDFIHEVRVAVESRDFTQRNRANLPLSVVPEQEEHTIRSRGRLHLLVGGRLEEITPIDRVLTELFQFAAATSAPL